MDGKNLIGVYLMYCSKCGTPIQDEAAFRSQCGSSIGSIKITNNEMLQSSEMLATIALEKLYPNLSNKWAWTIACAPIFIAILTSFFLNAMHVSNSPIVDYLLPFVINSILIIKDTSELRRNSINAENWIWLGFLLVPVYLFLRASKTNKKYGYAILWCVLLIVSIFI